MEKQSVTERRTGGRPSRWLYFSQGKMYFNKKTERAFYFVLTVIILIWGFLAKYDLWPT